MLNDEIERKKSPRFFFKKKKQNQIVKLNKKIKAPKKRFKCAALGLKKKNLDAQAYIRGPRD
jgi:hypothetical protein